MAEEERVDVLLMDDVSLVSFLNRGADRCGFLELLKCRVNGRNFRGQQLLPRRNVSFDELFNTRAQVMLSPR